MPQSVPFFFINQIFMLIFITLILIIIVQLTKRVYSSRYIWFFPRFYTDILKNFFKRAYESIEWGLNSLPKPHSFISLPIQSTTNLLKYLKSLITTLCKIKGGIINDKYYLKKISFNFRSYVYFLKAAWFLINKENLIYVSRHILSFLTYNNFKQFLKYMWNDKVLLLSILYISIIHKIMPLHILGHFELVSHIFHTIYIGITYAVLQLYKSCYRDFYTFSFKSFICNIALGIFIYNIFAYSLFIISFIIVFISPTCIYECLKYVHAFFKVQLYTHKGYIMHVFPEDCTDDWWAYRNLEDFRIRHYIGHHWYYLRELLTLPTSDVKSIRWADRYSYQENCQRFNDEYSKGLDKMLINNRVRKNWPELVTFLDNNYIRHRLGHTRMSAIQWNTAMSIRASHILDELNVYRNRYYNDPVNAYNRDNTTIGFLRDYAQMVIDNSERQAIRDSAILQELRSRAAERGHQLTGYTQPQS